MQGKINVVGLGPGSIAHMSARVKQILVTSPVIAGYKTYLDLIRPLIKDKRIIETGMRQEIDRCKEALAEAEKGYTVTLVSSGDAGVYGMAGLMLEVAKESQVEIEIVPGITAFTAAAALLGAPVMHDFAVISLSDLLTDLDLILERIKYACLGDFVIGLYNPKSKKRITQIEKAHEILMEHKGGKTPTGIVRNAMRENQSVTVTTLDDLLNHEIDMTSIVIIGNKESYIHNNKIITPRGYRL